MTLAEHAGIKITVVPMTHEHSKTKATLKNVKPMITSVLGTAAGKEYLAEQARSRKEMHLYCDQCLKHEDKERDGKMSVCAQCMRIGREVRYCSKVSFGASFLYVHAYLFVRSAKNWHGKLISRSAENH